MSSVSPSGSRDKLIEYNESPNSTSISKPKNDVHSQTDLLDHSDTHLESKLQADLLVLT